MTLQLWVAAPLVGIAVSQLAVIVTSVYLHRALAHRSLVLQPITEMVFRTVVWLTTGQSRRQWVAVHRKHHAFTDREGDPHSPQLFGFWRVQLLNAVYYMREARKRAMLDVFAPDLVDDRWDRRVFSHGLLGVGIGIGVLCTILGVWAGLLAALIHAVLYVGVLAPLINARGHWAGDKTFSNTAYNSRLLAWITGGEGLHNNHHAYPRAPKFSISRAEFDPSWPVIRLLASMNLASIRAHSAIARPSTDLDGQRWVNRSGLE